MLYAAEIIVTYVLYAVEVIVTVAWLRNGDCMEQNKGRRKNSNKTPGNQGFSLIELIISIVVLVIIMLPLFNNFYQSAKFNKKADELEHQSIIASNIMESIKSMNIEEIKGQFNGPVNDFTMIKPVDGNQTIEEVKLLSYDDIMDTYKFAINGIKQNDSLYDTVITMKADTFRMPAEGILNSYPMPEAINLDILANGIMFSDGKQVYPDFPHEVSNTDNDALLTLLQRGEAYARTIFEQSDEYQSAYAQWQNDCEEARVAGDPIPGRPATLNFNPALYPEYCDANTVKSEITKTMRITINQGVENSLSYDIDYQCNWPSSGSLDSTCRYNALSMIYPEIINNIYLFYIPTEFIRDNINVVNMTPEHGINFYVARQGEELLLPDITVNINDTDNINVFTNIENPLKIRLLVNGINNSEDIVGNIVNTEPKDRIYNIEIKLYKYINPESAGGKYKEELYSLTSSTENNVN